MNDLTKLIINIALIVLIGVTFTLIMNSQHPSIPTQHTIQIVDTTATVNAGTYVPYEFSIPSGASIISASGTFTAQGGSGNDIKVYLFDSTDYQYYKNGQVFTAIYESGQTHTATISTYIPSSGNYYLVLDNKFSTINAKTVDIQATATYTR